MPLNILQTEQIQLPEFKRKRLEKQQYKLIGNHSAVKICYWCKKSIRGEADCYKNDFYSVPSNQCLEMSPAITCNKRCKHCWRDTSVFSSKWVGPVDDPKFIVEESIKSRTNLMMGFFGDESLDKDRIKKSLIPNHAAISLTGEPMMYPRFPELIEEFFKQNFRTVFVVTSGTVPETIKALKIFPTNIYLSVEAWDKDMYKKLCIPVIPDAWERFLESAELLKNVPTRTVMKITCMKGLNMNSPENFAFLVEKMQPDIVACKAYAYMGYSKQRMKKENTPNFNEVYGFCEKLGKATNYEIANYKKGSDMVILRRQTIRKVNNEGFIYENIETEKKRVEEYLTKVKLKIQKL